MNYSAERSRHQRVSRLFWMFWIGLSLLISPILKAAEQQQTLSLTLQDMALPQAIRLLAKRMQLNVMLSPNITGVATLQLVGASFKQAFDLLLTSHQLAVWQSGNVLYIAPHEELMKRQQDELKWRAVKLEAAELVTRFWQIHYGKADVLARLIQGEKMSLLSKRGSVHVDARTNVLYAKDVAAHIAAVDRLIRKLDIPVKQVLIEARLASVDSDYERELGLDFAVNSAGSASSGLAVSEQGRYSLALVKLADGSRLDVKLSALETAGHAELISSPRLFTANQQPASIEAGEEVAYQEVSNSGGTAVAFKKAVLGLKVTPQILPGNRVLLALQINQDRPGDKMVLGVPTISTRQIVTSILVKAGQTVVLGGIFEHNQES